MRRNGIHTGAGGIKDWRVRTRWQLLLELPLGTLYGSDSSAFFPLFCPLGSALLLGFGPLLVSELFLLFAFRAESFIALLFKLGNLGIVLKDNRVAALTFHRGIKNRFIAEDDFATLNAFEFELHFGAFR